MSVEMASDAPKPKRDKLEKKHKSHNGEKKRKRDNEDTPSTHKKHRSESLKNAAAGSLTTVSASTAAPESPFHVQTFSLYLPLSPLLQRHPLEGLCAEHLSPLILQFYPPFGGVVLSYSNPRISEQPNGDDGAVTKALCIDEYGVSWLWVTADFLILKPERGVELEGHINLQNEGHIAMVCWNLFSASISRDRLPKDWRWVSKDEVGAEDATEDAAEQYDGNGYYVDGEGNKIEGAVKFRVKEIETGSERDRSFLTIVGTMLSATEEQALLQQEAEQGVSRKSAGQRLGGARAPGATTLGEPRSKKSDE